MVNPDLDGYTKTGLDHQKIIRKGQKEYWKPKEY